MLSSETKTVLRQYIEGKLSDAEMSDWLTGAEYDDALARDGGTFSRLSGSW